MRDAATRRRAEHVVYVSIVPVAVIDILPVRVTEGPVRGLQGVGAFLRLVTAEVGVDVVQPEPRRPGFQRVQPLG